MAAITELVDNFSTGSLDPQWNGNSGTVAVSSGQAAISPSSYLGTTNTYTAGELFAKMDIGGNTSSMWIRSTGSYHAVISKTGSNLELYVEAFGSKFNLETITYNATDHAWWRITVNSSSICTFFTSPDGVTWTQRNDSGASGMTSLAARFVNGSASTIHVDGVNTSVLDDGGGGVDLDGTASALAVDLTLGSATGSVTTSTPVDPLTTLVTLGATGSAARSTSSDPLNLGLTLTDPPASVDALGSPEALSATASLLPASAAAVATTDSGGLSVAVTTDSSGTLGAVTAADVLGAVLAFQEISSGVSTDTASQSLTLNVTFTDPASSAAVTTGTDPISVGVVLGTVSTTGTDSVTASPLGATATFTPATGTVSAIADSGSLLMSMTLDSESTAGLSVAVDSLSALTTFEDPASTYSISEDASPFVAVAAMGTAVVQREVDFSIYVKMSPVETAIPTIETVTSVPTVETITSVPSLEVATAIPATAVATALGDYHVETVIPSLATATTIDDPATLTEIPSPGVATAQE